MSKTCAGCQIEKPEGDFYTYKLRSGEERHLKKCKKCHHPTRAKKPMGFAKLDTDTQKKIIDMLKLVKEKKLTVKAIARELKINYSTLFHWVTAGIGERDVPKPLSAKNEAEGVS